ncbi:hypothetical protein PENTCL1PPCAC_29101 [Pristionchus entomophagus]|uniref:Uncharacterized protein n=1 Tax=Pristionchus entomophagus TaxID=358040 RepID=A0AAV5UKU7_9BILA|nr:hypothetical protein PENTCL1PPCAC_29101 [Pristionchus entomophagus]
MPTIPPYTIVDEGTDFLWSQISDIINEMGWRTHDNLSASRSSSHHIDDNIAVLSLLPSLASTRCAFARNDDDGSFLGGVVWTETDDDFVWIGIYVYVYRHFKAAASVPQSGTGR